VAQVGAQMGAKAESTLCFGPFRLSINERLLTRNGAPQPLSGRALDLLVALVSRPNQTLDKRELMAQVWPDVTVGEGSLRFHMAQLRKLLGDGKDGARYISTLAGRGYSFVGAISTPGEPEYKRSVAGANPPPASLPGRLQRMVGRDDCVLALAAQLAVARFVTITGTGGVGKTTVAVAVGHDLIEAFAGAVLFVDFGALSDPALPAAALAAMLGLSVRSDDAIPGIIAYLRDKQILLILDNCEHLIEAAATLAERIFLSAPRIRILATSREALRVEGEHVYKLEPLAFAPEDSGPAMAAALEYPAAQLFVERAAASGARIQWTDADAAVVAHICRRLDGVALAIELAAGRVAAYGLRQTAELLDQRLSLLWQGQRTAPPRQRTLQATLDWSYSLLSELERIVLRRLAVFVGYFTIHAALAVASGDAADESRVLAAIDSLVAKSMVAPRPLGAMMRYRLLETTRDYALAVGADDIERSAAAARHAKYYRQWLEQLRAEWPVLSNAVERQHCLAGLHNVRAALEWCFGGSGDVQVGVPLAAAAAHVLLALSLPAECHRWAERAIEALNDGARGGREEMLLQAALGMSLMFTRGMSEMAHTALLRSLAIAEQREDALDQVQLLAPLHMFHLRKGDYKTTLRYATRSAALSATLADPNPVKLSQTLLGITHHLTGDLDRARLALEAAIQPAPGSRQINAIYLGFDHRLWACAALARTLWQQGHPVQAIDRVRQAITDAENIGHPVTTSIVVNWCISVFFWSGDIQSAEAHLNRFIAHAEHHSLGPYLAVGRGRKGELAIRQGDPASGVELLRSCLAEFRATRYELLTTEFSLSLVQGLMAIGQFTEAMAVTAETLRLIEENGDFGYLPEVLRMQARLLLSMPQPNARDAETTLTQSLELSRRQGAPAWALRAAVDLAALLADQGRQDPARVLLRRLIDQFTEGSGTADLIAAESLLTRLG
jgi:predicted ATPase/DNA-binding winged helix-turn-helix (wHTH) protein